MSGELCGQHRAAACAQPDGPHISDELLHLGIAQGGLVTLPRQTVHQFLQVLSVQNPIIIKIFREEESHISAGPQ